VGQRAEEPADGRLRGDGVNGVGKVFRRSQDRQTIL
jgi:hypothetical protein